ncbi:hypothetical protein H4R18_005771 [Coemansia javaensis]|uniref:Uncharacterized protein n=1 Tax=Coemansia javaensis TaxID=2761396 RepID=A0A9W8LDS5_9FUNG|nr:hypothetical protein H4R18_005771 [Coemansia javaensis]
MTIATTASAGAPDERFNGLPLPPYQDSAPCMSEPGTMHFLNVKNGDVAHHRFLIVHGCVAGAGGGDSGQVTVRHAAFPAVSFPAVDGYFKALVHLDRGANVLDFEYRQDGAAGSTGRLEVEMEPVPDKRPLRLAVMVARDSPEVFDAPLGARGAGRNDLEAAVRRLRCAAYLWQAFIAEHMYRHGFGRRTFGLEEEVAADSMGGDEQARMTARVHVVRSGRTVAEIQAREVAQQWRAPEGQRSRAGELVGIHREAVEQSGAFAAGDVVACLTLDSRWDAGEGVLLGHGAWSSPHPNQSLALFGSHTTHAWPASAAEVAERLLDATATDAAQLCDDCGECGEHWRAASVGMGAFLHMVLHAARFYGGPTGIQRRGYGHFGRAFMAREPGRAGAVRQGDEGRAHLHRADAVALRYNPRYALGTDARPARQTWPPPAVVPSDEGVVIRAEDGVVQVALRVGGTHRAHLDYTRDCPTDVALGRGRLRELLGDLADGDSVTMAVFSRGHGMAVHHNIRELAML